MKTLLYVTCNSKPEKEQSKAISEAKDKIDEVIDEIRI